MKAVLNHCTLSLYLLLFKVTDSVKNLFNERRDFEDNDLNHSPKPVYRTPRLGR
jgi:hypothetical protein